MAVFNTNSGFSKQLATLGLKILGALAKQFPTCMSSKAFYFYPHYRLPRPKWSRWDDFSARGLTSILADISKWQQQLEKWQEQRLGSDAAVDLEMLVRVLVTLREQLEWVRPHQTQPTFYLSLASVGLAEALGESYGAFGKRISALPDLFRMAADNLQRVPKIHCAMGLEMAGKFRVWLDKLPLTDNEQSMADKVIKGFCNDLEGMETVEDFRLPLGLYDRIADYHMVCGMGMEEIQWHLDQEIEETEHLLTHTAARIAPSKPWPSVWQGIPAPSASPKDVMALFQGIIDKLKAHCLEQRFFEPHVVADCDVTVQTIPEHLMPVRANAGYTMPAGHPPKGGTFYILPLNELSLPRGLMLLAAHETFPGRHLMETLRWQLENPIRRSLTFPVFYQGWACIAEEILFDTDLFSGPADRLLVAKRRYWRAQKGLAELNLHTGKSSLDEAADGLCQNGLASRDQALAMVKRFVLKPGYQLAETIGRRKFRQLYTAYVGRAKTPAQFVSHVLSEGEVGFDHLAKRLLY